MTSSRRELLSSIVVGGSIGIAGCGTPTGDSPTPESTPTSDDTPSPTEQPRTPTETTATPDHAGDVFIVLQNQTAEQVTVAVTITTDNSVSFEAETTLEPEEIQHVYPEITAPGDYEVAVSIPGRSEQTRRFNIEQYDLEMGSNLNVWISNEEVQIVIEE